MEDRKVLVVDDEPGILKVLKIKLRHHGFEALTTTSGEEAIEMVRSQQPDVVLLDILMPKVTGLEVLDRVREFSRVPVIIFTANPKMVEIAMKIGANDSIAKPFVPDRLIEKIRDVLGNHQYSDREDNQASI